MTWARRLGAVRLVLTLTTLLAAVASAASAPFAALTVTPAGSQSYDIGTGVTTLPQGGTVVDQDTGVTLRATALSYLAGSSIDATGATVRGDFGTLTAPSLHIDVPTGTLTASGGVELTRDGLSLTASELKYDAVRQVVDFSGPVAGTAPTFHADRVLLDVRSGDVLLLGQYGFSDGLLTLTAPPAGGRLELRFHQVDGKPVYDAATEVAPELLARFANELN